MPPMPPKVDQLQTCDRRKAQIFRFLRSRLVKHSRNRGTIALWACATYMHNVFRNENTNYSIFNGMLRKRVLHMLIRDQRAYEMCFDDSPRFYGNYDLY